METMSVQNKARGRIPKNTLGGLFLICVLFLSVLFITSYFTSSFIMVLGTTLDHNERKSVASDTAKLNSQGLALLKLRKYNESLAYFDKALTINPQSFNALFGKARNILYLGKYNESLAYFDKALTINPNSYNVSDNIGVALLMLGKYNESLAYFDKALTINPNFVYGLVGKGIALVKLGKNNESIAYLNKALAINPKDINALNYISEALKKTNVTPGQTGTATHEGHTFGYYFGSPHSNATTTTPPHSNATTTTPPHSNATTKAP